MFMRYRGGGVGHLYMRAIEVWLTETGWGSDDILTPRKEGSGSSEEEDEDMEGKEDSRGEDEDEDLEGKEDSGSDKNFEDEVYQEDSDAAESNHSDSDQEHHSDSDMHDEEGEGTMDGEYGFSGF